MKTKTETYKDWAENLNLKPGKMSFYFMYWSVIVYIVLFYFFLISD